MVKVLTFLIMPEAIGPQHAVEFKLDRVCSDPRVAPALNLMSKRATTNPSNH